MTLLCKSALLSTAMVLFALSAFQPASAAVAVYTTRASFDAATAGRQDFNFSGIAPANSSVFGPQTVGGATFTLNDLFFNNVFVIDAGQVSAYGSAFLSIQSGQSTPPVTVHITLSGRRGFGFDYGSYINQNDNYQATLNTGEVVNFALAPALGTTRFLGFVSDGVPISIIDLKSTSSQDPNTRVLDIISFVTARSLANGVPEPSSWLMMIAGFGLIGAVARQKTRVFRNNA